MADRELIIAEVVELIAGNDYTSARTSELIRRARFLEDEIECVDQRIADTVRGGQNVRRTLARYFVHQLEFACASSFKCDQSNCGSEVL